MAYSKGVGFSERQAVQFFAGLPHLTIVFRTADVTVVVSRSFSYDKFLCAEVVCSRCSHLAVRRGE